jgi:uncharacterized protein with HEPN domain
LKRIADYIENYDFQSFKEDSKTVDAVIRNFEIIGEASKNIDNSIKNLILKCRGKKRIT